MADDLSSISEPDSARFQAVLLDLLSRGLTPEQVIERLQHDPLHAAFAAYVATFEPRMVEVAIQLVAKWGRREGGMPDSF